MTGKNPEPIPADEAIIPNGGLELVT